MENVVDLFSDIEIKKNDITVFDKVCDVKKEDVKKLKEKSMYKMKIEDLTSSIFSSLLEHFSDVDRNVHLGYGNCASNIWNLRNKYPKAKVVGIMFSGGLDSTTLLLRELNK